ncbi:hypothetical protein [Leifsonia sp. NPDC058248]|uniref:hypothetical protein n=1 Tax=Leifsonia sp. NPDC058248 TaxID=3346402 RepID=UPI0036DA96EC
MKTLDRLIVWMVGAFVLTAAFAAIFVTAQQIERQGADDAGTRLAAEVAASLQGGGEPRVSTHEDLGSSLEPFYIVYDSSDRPRFGTGYLHGSLATVPPGVLHAAALAPNRVTWQPQPGLRFATTSIRSGSETVLAGQSLAPSEARTDRLMLLLALGWFVCVIGLAAGAAVHLLLGSRRSANHEPRR